MGLEGAEDAKAAVVLRHGGAFVMRCVASKPCLQCFGEFLVARRGGGDTRWLSSFAFLWEKNYQSSLAMGQLWAASLSSSKLIQLWADMFELLKVDTTLSSMFEQYQFCVRYLAMVIWLNLLWIYWIFERAVPVWRLHIQDLRACHANQRFFRTVQPPFISFFSSTRVQNVITCYFASYVQ